MFKNLEELVTLRHFFKADRCYLNELGFSLVNQQRLILRKSFLSDDKWLLCLHFLSKM